MPSPADYFQQGFGQLGQTVQDVGNRSREPHPIIMRKLQEMLAGKHPRQAALEARLEMAQEQGIDPSQLAPPPAPQMDAYGDGSAPQASMAALQPPPPALSGMGAMGQYMQQANPGLPPIPGASMPAQGRPVMSKAVTGPAPFARPFNMQDAEDAKNLGLLKPERELTDTPEDRMARALLRAETVQREGAANRESREGIAGGNTASREKIEKAKLDEKVRQFDEHQDFEVTKLEQDWKKAVLRARTAIEVSREGRASAKDVAALKAVLSYASSVEAQITSLAKSTNQLGGQLGSSADLQNRLGALQSQIQALEPQVSDALKKAEQVMGSPGGASSKETTRASVPGPNLKAPDTSIPAGVGEMKMVPVISPDGRRGSIPAASLEEALKRGYRRQ